MIMINDIDYRRNHVFFPETGFTKLQTRCEMAAAASERSGLIQAISGHDSRRSDEASDIHYIIMINGSDQRRRFDLYFSGKTLQGEWLLEKLGDESHRSWSFRKLVQ
jgi:hypothetical protein